MEEYKKDFDTWNNAKKKLDKQNRLCSFCEKEIWWCSVGVNIGSEQDGWGKTSTRPVYILKEINSRTFLGIPLTKTLQEDAQHVSFYFNYDISTALISQVRIFDRKRLIEFMGKTSDYVHAKMKKTTAAFILS